MQPWNLSVTDIETDDMGCARFIVNSNITLADADDSVKAAKAMEAAPQMLAALIGLAKRCNGYLQQNPYSVPEYKAALMAIDAARGVKTTGTEWMDAIKRAEKVGAA